MIVLVVALLALGAAMVALRSHRSTSVHRGVVRLHASPALRRPVDWPAYGRDAARSHAAPYRLEPPFRVAWRETGDWSLVEFPPVVAGGRLFVGTNHGLLLALDAATGRRVWQRTLGRCIASSPAVAGDVVIVGVLAAPPRCDRDVPSFVAAFDVHSGRTLWRHRSGPVEASPLVVGDEVLTGSWDGALAALDTRTGRLRWSFATGGAVKGGAALAGPAAIVGSYDGSLYAVDVRTGRLRWSTPVGAPVYATPTIAGTRVFDATTDGVVHAVDAASGTPLWSRRIGRFAYSAAAVTAGRSSSARTTTGCTRSTQPPVTCSGPTARLDRSPARRPSSAASSSSRAAARARASSRTHARGGPSQSTRGRARWSGRSRTVSTAPSCRTVFGCISPATRRCTRS